MPTITPALSPSPTGPTVIQGGGGGFIGPSSSSGSTIGVITTPTSGSSGSGVSGAVYVAPATGWGSGAAGAGGAYSSLFYDPRLAQIYYLADKPWYDDTRFDQLTVAERDTSKNRWLIVAAVFLLARKL